MNARKVKQAIDLYNTYYSVPTVGNESVWIRSMQLIWDEIHKQASTLLNAKLSAARLLATDEASYLSSEPSSLNLNTRLRLLDGIESLPFYDQDGAKSEITLINGPYDLDNQDITINGAYISVSNTAILRSSTLGNVSGLLIQLVGNSISTTINIDTSTDGQFDNFYVVRKADYIELSLVGDAPYYCFNVLPSAAARQLGLQTGFIDSNSSLRTSAKELADKIGGTVHVSYSTKTLSIVDGVISENLGKCFLVLLDRNNELLTVNGNQATNYCNTSLSYDGKVRIVSEYVSFVINNDGTNIIPQAIVSTITSNMVKTSLANVLSIGDIVIDKDSRLEILKISNNMLTLSGRFYSNNLQIILGCYDTWHKMVDGVQIPDIQFPTIIDTNTIFKLREIASKISSFIAFILPRLSIGLTRNQMSAVLPLLNELQKQHLAMRADRACDILFQGDIGSYLLLDNTTCNYNLSVKQSTDELKSRL